MPILPPDSLSHLWKLGLSFALAFPIGWDRELEAQGAGVRTFPLVSLGSCGIMLVANGLTPGSPDANSRVLQGLITGIGFVGAGAILKSKMSVHGTATAASIWNMGVVGAATAFGAYDIALMLVAINFVTLRFLLPLKKRIDQRATRV